VKPESLMLISDAKSVLEKIAHASVSENPLAAVFQPWIYPEHDWPSPADVIKRAADAKGAELTSRGVAVLGFSCDLPTFRSKYESSFLEHLRWLMGRPNFGAGGEPAGVLVDPISLMGVWVGGRNLLRNEKRNKFDAWAAAVMKDAMLIAGESGFDRSLLAALEVCLTGNEQRLNGIPSWLRASLSRKGWGIISDTEVAVVLKTAIEDVQNISNPFEAGIRLSAIQWASSRALQFDLSALSVADLVRVLSNVALVFQRWTWEEKPRTTKRGAVARKWHIENEYHVQSLLYAVLKPVIPALEEEKYLASTGVYQPRADLALPALRLVIEAKFWYPGKKAKEVIEEIAADLSLYLRPDSPYDSLIAVIWDDAGRTQEHGELKRGLGGLNGMRDVVIVPKPSFMRD